MKIKVLLVGIVIAGLTFSGCQKIKSLLDTHFNTHFTVDINVNVLASSSIGSTAAVFQGSAEINPKDDADVAKYGNLIKSFEVTSNSATFNNVSGLVKLVSADISISSGSKSASWHIENVDLVNGLIIPLENSNGQWETMNSILGSLDPFTLSISGETDKDDVGFKLTLAIDATVTANPLGAK